MKTPNAFINYRRNDVLLAAEALGAQLELLFRAKLTFLDTSSISLGTKWPSRIEGALNDASLLIALIGTDWLTSRDEHGRRRLDLENDWVRNEIEFALANNISIIPVLIGDGNSMPVREALPNSIQDLLNFQAISLRQDFWAIDVRSLANQMTENHGFPKIHIAEGTVIANGLVVYPKPHVEEQKLSSDDLECELRKLSGWVPVEGADPLNYPFQRQEIRKNYSFQNFRRALRFMEFCSQQIDELNHHPRWENIFSSLVVHFTTWDVGNQVTKLDIEAAILLDELYDAYSKRG